MTGFLAIVTGSQEEREWERGREGERERGREGERERGREGERERGGEREFEMSCRSPAAFELRVT
jgi:hypothetical protein